MAGRQASKAAPDDPASIILRVIERISWRFPGFVLFDGDRRRQTARQQVSYTVNLSRECRGPLTESGICAARQRVRLAASPSNLWVAKGSRFCLILPKPG